MNLKEGVPLDNGTWVKVSPEGSQYHYVFFEGGQMVYETRNPAPLRLSPQSLTGRKIRSCFPEDIQKDTDKSYNRFGEVKQVLHEYLKILEEEEHQANLQKQLQEEEKEKKEWTDALAKYEQIEDPLIWLRSMIDWVSAGESNNIMIAFLTYCSQIILKHPVSLIMLGEGSSGKNHVLEIAKMLCPEDYFLNMKRPTLASVFRKGEEDPYYFDGKIISLGDLGGDNDHEELAEVKNIFKELQTDGELCRPISRRVDGEWIIVDLELKGRPCLNYSTVPNHNFDAQEKSRAILLTPRTDNQDSYFELMSSIEFVGSYTSNKYHETYDLLSEFMPLVVKGLVEKFNGVEVINPYVENIQRFVQKSDYFKRDFPKYNSMIKIISVLNYSNKEIHMINGKKIIFVSKEDLLLFFSLFNLYNITIQDNLSLRATQIYMDLVENMELYVTNSPDSGNYDSYGITINDYMALSKMSLSKSSMRNYFKELNEKNLIRTSGNYWRSAIYQLNSEYDYETLDVVCDLDEASQNRIAEAYGYNVLDSIIMDDKVEQKNIFTQHLDVERPPWQDNRCTGDVNSK
jgi:hypothetical protein